MIFFEEWDKSYFPSSYPDHGDEASAEDYARAYAQMNGDPLEADDGADEIAAAATDEYLHDMAAERFANTYAGSYPSYFDTSDLKDTLASIPSEEEIDQARADAEEAEIEDQLRGEGPTPEDEARNIAARDILDAYNANKDNGDGGVIRGIDYKFGGGPIIV